MDQWVAESAFEYGTRHEHDVDMVQWRLRESESSHDRWMKR